MFVIVNVEGKVTREFHNNAADIIALALEMTCEGDEDYSKRIEYSRRLVCGTEPVKCANRGRGVPVSFSKPRDLWQL